MASKEDPTVQFWEFVQENLLQFHCENVSWEQASDKIPIKVVVELLGDLITHVNTCLLLRNNRLLFTLNWGTIENGQVVWEHLHSFHLNQKRRLETPQYQCDYMLTSVSSYSDLVDTYCYAFDKQSHPSFMREDILNLVNYLSLSPLKFGTCHHNLVPLQRKPFLNQFLQLDSLNPFRIWIMVNSLS